MVAKMSSGNSLYGALAYNQNKVDKGLAKVLFTQKMIQNPDGTYPIPACLKSFEPYLSANQKTEKPVLHVSLNPDPKDNLSDEQLSQIAQAYMEKMGYGNQPFIVYKHEDIERRHIHIVSLRIDENGRKINDKYERRRSMAACRELEKDFNLIPAVHENLTAKSRTSLSIKAVNYKKSEVKNQILNVLQAVSQGYNFLSLKEYKTALSLYNVGLEEIKGGENGKKFRGLAYFALNKKGEKAGNPFPSSAFGKNFGIGFLERRMKKSTERIKAGNLKEPCKKAVSAVMETAANQKDFQRKLEKQGISAVFRQNGQGRIYGVTFIDHRQKAVFNGSRLGKEFSANAFNELFNGKENHFKHSEFQRDDAMQNKEKFDGISGILDLLFPPETTAEDYEEQSFLRRHKRKKRPKR